MSTQPVNGAIETGHSAGTCLHFGTDGKRCYRAATISGFCERHDPERTQRSAFSLVRLAAALLLLWALLWPVIADVVRELRGWLQ